MYAVHQGAWFNIPLNGAHSFLSDSLSKALINNLGIQYRFSYSLKLSHFSGLHRLVFMNSDLSSQHPAMLPKVDTFKTYPICEVGL